MSNNNADSISIDPLSGPVKAEITIPGSKSITNRALLLGALSEKRVTIKNALIADDTEAMLSALNKLGIKTVRNGNEIKVIGSIKDVKDKKRRF